MTNNVKLPEDKYIEVSGINTRYWVVGDKGPNLVLIHGIASSVEDWQSNVQELSKNFRVFALDLVGCGKTDKPEGFDYSIESLTDFVLQFMTKLNIQKAHLGGFSLGAHIALKCANLAPERVASLVLQSPAGMDLDTIFNFRLATVRGLGELLTKPSKFGLRGLLKAAYYDGSLVTDELIEERLELAKIPGNQTAFLSTLRSFVRLRSFEPTRVAQLENWIPNITCSALVIWGKQDKFVSVKHAEKLQKLLSDCRVEVIDECGHLPMAEHSDKFNELVGAFLTAHKG